MRRAPRARCRRRTRRHRRGAEGFQPHPEHEHLYPRDRYGTPRRGDERRFARQYRRILVARARMAGTQPPPAARFRSAAVTLFLASVTGPEEADVALANGA